MSFDISVDPQVFNDTFLANLETQTGIEKQAAVSASFLKDRVRETSFLDEIIPPKPIGRSELDISISHDQPVKISFLEPEATAKSFNFRGAPDEKWIDGKKYEIPFYKIATDKLKKNEAEIMSYRYPITQVIEEIMVKEMATVKDTVFMAEVEGIIAHTHALAGHTSTMNIAADFGRDAIVAGLNLLDAYELNCGTILMSKRDWNIWNASVASDVGDGVAEEMVRNGYATRKIMGRKIVVTNKRALVAPGTVYFFSPADTLGENYILSDVKFQIKKDADIITMEGWGYYGTGIGNIRSIVKVNLQAWGN